MPFNTSEYGINGRLIDVNYYIDNIEEKIIYHFEILSDIGTKLQTDTFYYSINPDGTDNELINYYIEQFDNRY